MNGEMREMQLSKHHGAGNDFLVVTDPDGRAEIGADLARALCDRRFGVGADGVLHLLPGRGGCDVAMELFNADGSRAEMSGNGIRCLAQAAVDAGMVTPPSFTVATDAGPRRVEYRAGGQDGGARVSVDMGAPSLGPDQPQHFADRRARTVDMGNPHLVLLGPDPASVDVVEVGRGLQGAFAAGINVEFVAVVPGSDEITLRVYERGVGETLACGTGSCAAAAAAHAWGLVGRRVTVVNPGGPLEVTLDDHAWLEGPAWRVADLSVDTAVLLAATRPVVRR